MAKEADETLEDELKETPEEQATEKEEGTEEHPEAAEEAIEGEEAVKGKEAPIPEAFQHKVTALVDEYGDSKVCLEFLRNHVDDKLDEIARQEMSKQTKSMPKKGTPSTFSTEDAPELG